MKKQQKFIYLSIFLLGLLFLISSCQTLPPIPQGPPTDIIYSPIEAPMGRHDLYHVIGPAETVYRISKMYDVPVDTILKANDIANPKDLRIGQRLLIPEAAS